MRSCYTENSRSCSYSNRVQCQFGTLLCVHKLAIACTLVYVIIESVFEVSIWKLRAGFRREGLEMSINTEREIDTFIAVVNKLIDVMKNYCGLNEKIGFEFESIQICHCRL